MGRPKKFSRDGVLEKALPVFWKHGFAGTSLQDLEAATGVNKSGLYSEFKDKEDLFLASLRYYFETRGGRDILLSEPLGWGNVERFLKLSDEHPNGQRGCFSVSSMREFAILPSEALEIVTGMRSLLRPALIRNIEAEKPRLDAESLAELVTVFFSGICVEQHLDTGPDAMARRIASFMQIVRGL